MFYNVGIACPLVSSPDRGAGIKDRGAGIETRVRKESVCPGIIPGCRERTRDVNVGTVGMGSRVLTSKFRGKMVFSWASPRLLILLAMTGAAPPPAVDPVSGKLLFIDDAVLASSSGNPPPISFPSLRSLPFFLQCDECGSARPRPHPIATPRTDLPHPDHSLANNCEPRF